MSPLTEPAVPADALLALIAGRRHTGPRHLAAPGPDTAQLRRLLEAAATAPDHGRLRPWRFLVLGPQARGRLAGVFVDALLARDPGAGEAEQAAAREKAGRAPVLLLAIARTGPDEAPVPAAERLVSFGAAVQNLLLAARALGFDSGLSSGRALDSAPLRSAFGLAPGEQALCFISLGTASRRKPGLPRPDPDTVARWLD